MPKDRLRDQVITKKPAGRRLTLWRRLRLRELMGFRSKSSPVPYKGTPQRKVRWGRGSQRGAALRNRVSRNRARTAITRKVQRLRKAKGRNPATGR